MKSRKANSVSMKKYQNVERMQQIYAKVSRYAHSQMNLR